MCSEPLRDRRGGTAQHFWWSPASAGMDGLSRRLLSRVQVRWRGLRRNVWVGSDSRQYVRTVPVPRVGSERCRCRRLWHCVHAMTFSLRGQPARVQIAIFRPSNRNAGPPRYRCCRITSKDVGRCASFIWHCLIGRWSFAPMTDAFFPLPPVFQKKASQPNLLFRYGV